MFRLTTLFGSAGFAVTATVLWLATLMIAPSPTVLFLPPALGVGALGGYVLWQAIFGRPWALLSLLGLAVGLLDISFRIRPVGEVGLDAQAGIKVIFWVGTGIVCLFNLSSIVVFLRDRVIASFFCYCLIAILSALYSPVPMLSSVSAVGVTVYFGFGCLLASRVSERTLLLVMLWSFAAVSVINLASLALPEMAFRTLDDPQDFLHVRETAARFVGVMGAPNTVGEFTSIYGLVLFAVVHRGYLKWPLWLPQALLIAVLLALSQSRTAAIALFASLLLQVRVPWGWTSAMLLAGGVLVWVSGAIDGLLALIGREGSVEDAATLAGRTELWDFVFEMIGQRPILGYGFNSFEAYASQFWTGQTIAGAAAHNNYLSILYSTGVAGFVPFVCGFLGLLYRWFTRPDPVRDVFTVNMLITGITEIGVFSSIAPEPTLMFMMILALDAKRWMR